MSWASDEAEVVLVNWDKDNQAVLRQGVKELIDQAIEKTIRECARRVPADRACILAMLEDK